MKEQIEEMAKEMCEVCYSKPFCKVISAHCPIAIRDAERLYNAGYRKQKEAKWGFKGTAYGCSLCGEGVIAPIHNFCPNCGAHMRGGENE